MSEKDKEEIVKEILILDKKETLNSHDEFMLGLYNIALQYKLKWEKVEKILDALDRLKSNENNHNAETIKLCLNKLGVDDKAISALFDLFRRDGRYKELTAVWKK